MKRLWTFRCFVLSMFSSFAQAMVKWASSLLRLWKKIGILKNLKWIIQITSYMRCASVFTCEVAVAADFCIVFLKCLTKKEAVGGISKILSFVRKLIHPFVYLHSFFQICLSLFQYVFGQNVSHNPHLCISMVGMYYQSAYYIQHITARFMFVICAFYSFIRVRG